MIQIDGITTDAYQLHKVKNTTLEANIYLRYAYQVERWFCTVEDVKTGKSSRNFALAVSARHIQALNVGYDIIVSDESAQGVDPMYQEDFAFNRCKFYIVMNEELYRAK